MRRATYVERAERRMAGLAWARAHARAYGDWPREKELTKKIEKAKRKLAERGAA